MLIWLAGVLAGMALFGVLGGLVLALANAPGRVEGRVQQFVALNAPAAPAVEARVRKQQRNELFEQLDERWQRRPTAQLIASEIDQAGLQLTVTELTLFRFGTMALAALLVVYLAPGLWWLLILPALFIGWRLPRIYLRQQARRRLRKIDNQLPDILNILASSVRGGSSLFQALDRISKEAPEPSNIEYNRMVRQIALGAPMDAALRDLSRRVPSEDIDILVTAIAIQQQTGGNLAHVLELIATTVRERHRVEGEIRVLSAQQRFSAWILAALPLLLAGLLYIISPKYISRLFEPGWILLLPGLMVVLLLLGFLFMRRIAQIDV